MSSRALRLCCAILLMVMALAVGTGIVSAQREKVPEENAVCPYGPSAPDQKGSVTLFSAPGEDFHTITYTLHSGSFEVVKTLYFASGECELSFEQLPFGAYTLYADDVFCCRFTLSAEQPRLILSIT